MGIRPEQLGTAAAITSLLKAADAADARTALGVPALAGDVFTGPVQARTSVLGLEFVNANSADTYYRLASLRAASDVTSYCRLTMDGWLDDGWAASAQMPFTLDMASRGGLTVSLRSLGPMPTLARIVAYREPDNTYTVWLRLKTPGYTSASINIRNAVQASLYREPATGTPSGTLVYDTGDAANYPPDAVLYFAPAMRAFLACTNDAAARAELGLGSLSVLNDVVPDATTRAAPTDNTTWFEYEEGMGEGYISLIGPGHIGSTYEQNVRVCAQIGGVKYSNILQRT